MAATARALRSQPVPSDPDPQSSPTDLESRSWIRGRLAWESWLDGLRVDHPDPGDDSTA